MGMLAGFIKGLIGFSAVLNANVPVTLQDLKEASRTPNSGIVFLPIPLMRQSRRYACGPAVLQSILKYWGDTFREAQLEALLQTNDITGTSYVNIVRLVQALNDPVQRRQLKKTPDAGKPSTTPPISLDSLHPGKDPDGYRVELYPGKKKDRPGSDVPEDGLTLIELEKTLQDGKPVILAIQAWADTASPIDWPNEYDQGHYVVAVGYDTDRVYFMDPAVGGNYAYLDKADLLDRWHDLDTVTDNGKSVTQIIRHFGLAIYKPKPLFQPQQIVPIQ